MLIRVLAAISILGVLGSPAIQAETTRASQMIDNLADLPDRHEELSAAIEKNGGSLILAKGVYRITRPLEFHLEQQRSALIQAGDGPVTLVMDGPGPAIRIVGSHHGSASPKSFQPGTWRERMPVIEGIEIVGNHAEADGIELIRTVFPSISQVSVRWCRHGIRLAERNRNVTISDVHLYENQGIGLYLDDVNLHQINVGNSHISYNRGGGIVVRDGNVRNLHITGCDIEANMPHNDEPSTTANILFDLSGTEGERTRSICEVAITGCTIQHSSNYSGKDFKELAPGAANIRLRGKRSYPIDSVTITGNVMSDVCLGVDILHATDVAITGNNFFAPNPDFLHVTDSKRIVVNGNTFNPREFERPGRIVLTRVEDSVFSNSTLRGLLATDGAIQVKDCRHLLFSANVLTESASGFFIENSQDIAIHQTLATLPKGTDLIVKDAQSVVNEQLNVISNLVQP